MKNEPWEDRFEEIIPHNIWCTFFAQNDKCDCGATKRKKQLKSLIRLEVIRCLGKDKRVPNFGSERSNLLGYNQRGKEAMGRVEK